MEIEFQNYTVEKRMSIAHPFYYLHYTLSPSKVYLSFNLNSFGIGIVLLLWILSYTYSSFWFPLSNTLVN